MMQKDALPQRLPGVSRYFAVVVLALLFALSFGPVFAGPIEDCQEHAKYGVPNNDPVLLCREAYLLSHSPERKAPTWVVYHLTSKYLKGKVKRAGSFRADPDLPKGERAEKADYKNSGYDQGHMMPAADAKRSMKVMKEAFYLSNIAPQVGEGLNRGIWEVLETQVRTWAQERGELYVYVGPLYIAKRLKTIGTNKVAVPTHFYKVVFDPNAMEAVAFIFPNIAIKGKDFSKYKINIKYLEQESGLVFFSSLSSAEKSRIKTISLK